MAGATSTSASTSPTAEPPQSSLTSLSPPSIAMACGDSSSQLSSATSTQTLSFSSGNPRIEETRGVIHFFSDDVTSSSSLSELPVGRKPLACVLGVPNHMTYADFCRFSGSFIQHMLEMRIVRNDEMEDRYIVLVKFDSQESTDGFYKHFNGQTFSSLEPEACHVHFTIDVQYTGSIERGQASLLNSTEQPTCPVCLERLDQETGGILTTICNHSFHCSCISKWTDSSCPVCRYCQQKPDNSTCFVCQTSENLWICVICGFVGCGRKRLIQSKTDGKLVELNVPCSHAAHGCGSFECGGDPGIDDAIVNSKVEAIVNEYNELLSTQLENQKLYFESLLQEIKEETEKDIAEAVDKAVSLKLQKLQAKVDRCMKEKKFLDEINENLLKNQEIWKAKIQEIEGREEKAVRLKDDKIRVLEEQLKDLMLHLEAGQAVEQLSVADEVDDGAVLKLGGESSTTKATNSKNRKKR
ncbi:hypothetical protein SOVF_095110 isoform C [Spinacia oleracea]|nr:hypothetical protein SOVF_095110 isoform C [Spinacia oleracea]